MKPILKIVLLMILFSSISSFSFAQYTCTGTGLTPAKAPAVVPAGNITLKNMNGTNVTSILPNTQYRLTVIQPAETATTRNSWWTVKPYEGFGHTQWATGFGEDGGPGATTTHILTSDAVGGAIIIDVRGGSGGGAYKLCTTDAVTRKVFP